MNVHLIPPAFERIFQSPKWLGGDKVKHVIEPRIDYKFVDGIDDFNNIIRFDENDLMNDTNQVTFSLTNRLLREGQERQRERSDESGKWRRAATSIRPSAAR